MKKFNLAVVLAAVATMAVASAASAKVERYQELNMTFIAQQPAGEVAGTFWVHTFNVTLNPCDGSFEGTGSQTNVIGLYPSATTVTGETDGETISFFAKREDGVQFWLNDAVLGGEQAQGGVGVVIDPPPSDSWQMWTVDVDVDKTKDATDYKNHGDFVRHAPDKNDAAHSCIGMPIH
jgi:hypothetical protein